VTTLPQAPAVERRLKIAVVHTPRNLSGEVFGAMNVIRFVRIAEAFARRGHDVHLVVKGASPHLPVSKSVRIVEPSAIRWEDYDVVKASFHGGFEALSVWGGDHHPFIVTNLGSVVGSEDTEGVYFYGDVRERLWKVQQGVAARSRIVSLLTKPNADLFKRMHGDREGLIEVPAGVDAEIPEPGANPYRAAGITRPVALYAGNIYSRDRQAEVNLFWQERLNALGRKLSDRGIQLVAMGPGATDRLDPSAVIHLGIIDFREFWNWQWHAQVGVALAQGPVQDNESSKLYYYLRTGLPVVCEGSVPNAWLVTHTQHGAVVPYDTDVTLLADAAASLVARPPDARPVMQYVLDHHTWDARAASYASTLAAAFARPSTSSALEADAR